MSKESRKDLQGTLDLLILKSLAQLGSMHGYGVVLHIQQVTDEALQVEEGSLYPALYRSEQAGWIKSEWRASANNRRARYYSLTAAGRKQLAKEEESWQRLVKGVNALLRFA